MRTFLYDIATDRHRGFVAGIFKFFLFLLSLVYGLFIRTLSFFYCLCPHRLDCKVISVGNITLGGTGKTVLVEFIAQYLKVCGHKVAVLSRGYKKLKTKNSKRKTQKRKMEYEAMGDEPYMLSRKLADIPIVVDADRIRAAQEAKRKFSVDTIILDDGFQQWRIVKDLEIVTVDATNPFGNRHMLPRGILRQPLSSLRRADIFVLTKTSRQHDLTATQDVLRRLNPGALIVRSIYMPAGFLDLDKPQTLLDIEKLKTKPCAVFSGIADPDSFEGLLRDLGFQVSLKFRFEDHHNYTQEDLDEIIQACAKNNIGTAITTEKDAARLIGLGRDWKGLDIVVSQIHIELQDEEKFFRRLLGIYSF